MIDDRRHLDAIADADQFPYWYDDVDEPDSNPARFLGIQATRWSLEREDRSGKRNLWLRTLDRLGLGFDS